MNRDALMLALSEHGSLSSAHAEHLADALLPLVAADHIVHVTAAPIAEDAVWCDECEAWVTSGAPEGRADALRTSAILRDYNLIGTVDQCAEWKRAALADAGRAAPPADEGTILSRLADNGPYLAGLNISNAMPPADEGHASHYGSPDRHKGDRADCRVCP